MRTCLEHLHASCGVSPGCFCFLLIYNSYAHIFYLQVSEVGGLTNTARRLISSISRRETQQKLMLWGVAASLLIAIILIIYYSSR